jgi:hypothetical protein
MPTFEEGFAAAENAADSMLKALSDVATLARQLRRASQDGNIAAIRRTSERLDANVNRIRQEAANAANAWPFTEEAEREYLEDGYTEELKGEAQKKGLQVFDRDGRLIAHPSVVRVMPGERAVRIDRRQSSAVRPTKIVADLEKLQNSPPRSNPQQLLEKLYQTYLELTDRDTADSLKLGKVGQVVRLNRVYSLWTGRPQAEREYSRLDFARDLYNLETSGVNQVRSRARVSFPASAGTRSTQGIISFVGPDGEPVLYYGIQFTGAGQ